MAKPAGEIMASVGEAGDAEGVVEDAGVHHLLPQHLKKCSVPKVFTPPLGHELCGYSCRRVGFQVYCTLGRPLHQANAANAWLL